MTSSEHISASNRSVYDTCDPDYLRQLREASGVEETWLARTACLSLAQVRQLEEGGESLFYSPTIKRQAYKRLLMLLGAEPPSVVVDVIAAPVPSVVHDLNEIIAMGEKNLDRQSAADFFLAMRARVSQHKISAMVVLVMGVTAMTSLVLPTAGLQPTANLSEHVSVKVPESMTLAALPSLSPVATAPAESVQPVLQVPTSLSTTVAPATVAASASVSAPASCQYTRDPLPHISPLAATKPSRYVHMVATTDVTVCVVDGNQQASLLKLKAGESQSVFGTAPWQVSSTKLAQLQIYFQGWRVALPEGTDQRVALIEKPN